MPNPGDGDGVALVGQALGGDAPKLRVNALRSESERNIQKGIEHILRGMYLAIRNPRSHEQFQDNQQDADAIVHFVDYVLRVLNASSEAFTIKKFLDSTGDTEFVESKRYAELLVAEIPQNRCSDALVALFEVRTTVDARKLRFLISTLLSALDEPQLAQYLAIVSDEMRTATEFAAIRSLLQMLTPELWPKTSETGRLRIENKLIREIKEGEILVRGKTTGVLGTWAGSFMKAFTLRKEGANILISKLEDNDADDRHYVAKYFLHHLPEILIEEGEMKRAVRAISTAIRNEDPNLREAVISRIRTFPTSWQSKLSAELQDITDPKNPAVILDDGAPFLAAPTATEITDDDIPF